MDSELSLEQVRITEKEQDASVTSDREELWYLEVLRRSLVFRDAHKQP